MPEQIDERLKAKFGAFTWSTNGAITSIPRSPAAARHALDELLVQDCIVVHATSLAHARAAVGIVGRMPDGCRHALPRSAVSSSGHCNASLIGEQ